MYLQSQAAETPSQRLEDFPFVIISPDSVSTLPSISDEEFYRISASVRFSAGKSVVYADSPFVRAWNDSIVGLVNKGHLQLRKVMIRGAASPEGGYSLNKRLGRQRSRALLTELRRNLHWQYHPSDVQLTNVNEDYAHLVLLMREARDRDAERVARMVERHHGDEPAIKEELMAADGGRLWNRLKRRYFHYLRTARIVLWFSEPDEAHLPIEPLDHVQADFCVLASTESHLAEPMQYAPELPSEPAGVFEPLLAAKTNMLLDFAPYIPDYGWCPMPNMALEYFFPGAHWSIAASLDMPWHLDPSAHRYFQARNWQLEPRWYAREGRGFFASAYANAVRYGIGLDGTRGIQGEGLGAGIGLGWVFRLGRDSRWHLELSANAGYFWSQYDRYVYGDPVNGEDTGLYYYSWKGNADDFVPRLYRQTWVGPTKAAVTLRYDLLRRKKEGSR